MKNKMVLSIILSLSLLFGTAAPAFADVDYSESGIVVAENAQEDELDREPASPSAEDGEAPIGDASSDGKNEAEFPNTADTATSDEEPFQKEGEVNDNHIENNDLPEAGEEVSEEEIEESLVGALESTGNATLDGFINDSRFTAGVYWGGDKRPVISSYDCWSCCAYCADYAKYCYGIDSPRGGTVFYDINEIRQGDVLIVGNPSNGKGHWFVCLNRSGNRLYVAEGNVDGYVRIGWNYTISGSKFAENPYNFNCGYHFNNDNSGPAYSDFHVGELREGAFTVMAHVTDPNGIQGVRYAIWTEKNGQDDLIWYDGHCTDGNDYYWARVNFSEHNGERGLYIIHMYAYDNNGNLTNPGITFCFDEEGPEISDVVISDISSNGYTVTCKVTDPSGVLRVQFPTWTVFEGQDDLAPNWDTNASVRGTLNGNIVTFRVETSAHNNEVGKYYTHIYAFDILGNCGKVLTLAIDVPGPATDINACTVSLSATTCTYDGSAKKPSVTVKDGSTTLISGTDYTVEYSDNINAGTATVIITGTGNYNGTINKTFTINQAAPKLTFADTSISKTTLDPAFTNELTKTTDGTVTFDSTNKSVATVNRSSGKVTIKGAGTTTITATAAAGTNYKAGSAQYTLTITKVLNIVSISDDFYGKTGTQASFHIEAEGSGTISYQWQYRTTGMSDWKSPAQASAKTTDYVFNLKPSYDNIEVRCIVSDDSGAELISEQRKANVFAFTSQPADATAWDGQVVNFEVSAIGHNVTYQWYYKRPGGTWKRTTIAGSNTAVLPITAGTINDGTSYRCVITDEAGNKITSAAGLLTLDNSLRITGISEDAYDVNGESVTFHIDAAGSGELSYQWQYKLAGESKWRTPAQASAKTADYVFKLRTSYDNIEVRCIVKDASGNSVTSDVRKANVFAITGQPQDAELEMGELTTFAVEAVGKDLAYQWYYMRPESSWKKVTVAGFNTASLMITANTKNDGTKFQCRITDGLGNMLISAAATLTQS